MTKTCSTCWRD